MAVWITGFFLTFLVFAPSTEAKRVISPERPVVPNVTATSPTEIKMNWCRVRSNNIEIDHYELFIDNELEYSGIDVMYVAKRLKAWTAYEVKLRACGFLPGASCSPFSRPILVKTLPCEDNTTTIQSTASVFKVAVLLTYTFIIGFLVGVVILAMALVWRYLQSNDMWTNEPAFELPQYIQQQDITKIKINAAEHQHNNQRIGPGTCYTSNKAPGPIMEIMPPGGDKAGGDNSCYQIVETRDKRYETTSTDASNHVFKHDVSIQVAGMSLPLGDFLTIQQSSCVADGSPEQVPCDMSPMKVEQDSESFMLSISNTQANGMKEELVSQPGRERLASIGNTFEVKAIGSNSLEHKVSSSRPSISQVGCHYNTAPGCATLIYTQDQSCSDTTKSNINTVTVGSTQTELVSETDHFLNEKNSSETLSKENNTSLQTTCDTTKGIVCVIDNSNIYIGAQECASGLNAGDRKRSVRVKLQNLVRILEKNRMKERSFVCGSSPPATEHVWEVYRHLGYIVDLEERRGKDEQRVDEGLHLCIYKAICELSPRVLVLATGDGMKGKSENSTSFPGCATMALEKGWQVELYSWKHSLSAEWNKLARKYPNELTIHYLDKFVNHITFVDGRNGRKCLPFPAELERNGNTEQRSGRPMHHNG